MTHEYKFRVGQKVVITDIQADGRIKVRAGSKDGQRYCYVEYFSSLLKSMTVQYFKENQLEGL